ncbi:MAG: hypothetical protein LBT45_03105 [Rickettsiales bacterium]|jgi:hypothetical protein|nr:hypothetical protein [Rickettsiales bacterium]
MFYNQFEKIAEKSLEGGHFSGCPLSLINSNRYDIMLSSEQIQMLKEFTKSCPGIKMNVDMWKQEHLQRVKRDVQCGLGAKYCKEGFTEADILALINKNDVANVSFDLNDCGIADMEYHKNENRLCWFKFGQYLARQKIRESI